MVCCGGDCRRDEASAVGKGDCDGAWAMGLGGWHGGSIRVLRWWRTTKATVWLRLQSASLPLFSSSLLGFPFDLCFSFRFETPTPHPWLQSASSRRSRTCRRTHQLSAAPVQLLKTCSISQATIMGCVDSPYARRV